MARRQFCEIADAMLAAYLQHVHDQRAAVVAMAEAFRDNFTRIAARNIAKSLADYIIGGEP